MNQQEIHETIKEITLHLRAAQTLIEQLDQATGVHICSVNDWLNILHGIEVLEPLADEPPVTDCRFADTGHIKRTFRIDGMEILQLAEIIDGRPVFERAQLPESVDYAVL